MIDVYSGALYAIIQMTKWNHSYHRNNKRKCDKDLKTVTNKTSCHQIKKKMSGATKYRLKTWKSNINRIRLY